MFSRRTICVTFVNKTCHDTVQRSPSGLEPSQRARRGQDRRRSCDSRPSLREPHFDFAIRDPHFENLTSRTSPKGSDPAIRDPHFENLRELTSRETDRNRAPSRLARSLFSRRRDSLEQSKRAITETTDSCDYIYIYIYICYLYTHSIILTS